MPRHGIRWWVVLACVWSGLAVAQEKKDEPKKQPAGGEHVVLVNDELPSAIVALVEDATRITAELSDAEARVKEKKDDPAAKKKEAKLKDERKKATEEIKKQIAAAGAKADAEADRLGKELDKLAERLATGREPDAANLKKQHDAIEKRLMAINELRDAYNVLVDYVAGQVGRSCPFSLIGNAAPAGNGKLLWPENKTVYFPDDSGKVVVLVFFATEHRISAAVYQELLALASGYPPEAVTVLGIAVDAEREAVKASLGKTRAPVIFDADHATARQYLVKFLPEVVLLAPDGTVGDVFIGRTNGLRSAVKRKLDELVKLGSGVRPAGK